MTDEPTITVRGESLVRAEPDEVELQLEVHALEETPEAAYAEAARRSQAVDAVLNELGVAQGRRSTAGLSVREEVQYREGREESRGYVASNRIGVRVDDLGLVGRLIGEATRTAQARVEGPRWRIAPDNSARTEARRLAAADARRRAEAYAEALGLRLGAVLDVAEPGVQIPRAPRLPAGYVASSIVSGDIELSAGNLDVLAAVEVTFALERADGGESGDER